MVTVELSERDVAEYVAALDVVLQPPSDRRVEMGVMVDARERLTWLRDTLAIARRQAARVRDSARNEEE